MHVTGSISVTDCWKTAYRKVSQGDCSRESGKASSKIWWRKHLLQVDKELHRSLKQAAEKDNTTLSDYITELFLKHVEFKSSIVKNPKNEPDKKSSKKQRLKKSTNKLRLFEAFAGYSGASFALKKAKIKHEIVGFSENDKFAVDLYEGNHKGVKNFGDITLIDPKNLPDFDFFTGGFPCQPFCRWEWVWGNKI